MLKNLFKKADAPATATNAAAATTATSAKSNAKPKAKSQPMADTTDWQTKLAEAIASADDAVLLQLALAKAPLKIRLSAVEAMQTEDGLKACEREFREHDRSIHRQAKLRLETKIAERIARAEAATLIYSANELLTLAQIPANRLVELDRAWQAIDQPLLTSLLIADYAAASEKITHLLRSRGDLQLLVKRWSVKADGALLALQSGSIAVAETGLDRDKLGAAYEALDNLQKNMPALIDQDALARDVAHKNSLLDAALQLARALDARLGFLDGVLVGSVNADTAAWHALPAVADTKIAELLNQRFEASLKAKQQATDSVKRAAKDASTDKKKIDKDAKLASIETLLNAAETGLAEGHMVEASTGLAAIEIALKSVTPNPAMQHRIGIVRSEIARLKGWQHWGGGRVREDLVAEAEVLEKAITDEKLHIKTHADAIEKLRERWKELDKLGGATNRDLWANFDNALKTAYLPVSAQLAKLKAVRQDNLGARNLLIAGLDGVVLPTAEGDAKPLFGAEQLRELSKTLDHFQTEWRKLGPLEHTVPHKAQESLLKRMKASVARLETPLNDARQIEASKREKLIERAKALTADSQARETINKVRELQTEWQQCAKSLPLQRHVENKLWAEFKTATDAVFQARDTANTARDGVFQANAKVRDELIAKLNALSADSAPNEIKRTLIDVEQAWRRAGEAPRAIADKIEQRYRAARDTVTQYAAGSAKRVWQKTTDSLHAKLALCIEAEASATANADTFNESWNAAASLPAVWEKPLRLRLDAALAGTKLVAVNNNDALLKLEAALEMDSPAEFQAARREMKLLAMKTAIQMRQAVTVTNADIEQFIATAISAPMPESLSSTRLSTILQQLVNRPLTK